MKWDKSKWKTRTSLSVGQRGTAQPYEEFGDKLLCVRYRYDGNGMRIKTVEIVVDIAKVGRGGKT